MKFALTFFIALSSLFTLRAQNAPIDYEALGYGAAWTWTVFENDTNPALEIVPNPDISGMNTSCTVAKFTAMQTGNPWAGCETLHGAGIGSWTISASNQTIKILVWKSVISDVGIKLVRFDNWSLGEIKVPNTLINQWEEITFDFSAHIGNTYDQIVIFPDFQTRSSENIVYFDHVYGDASTAIGCGCIPVSAPPVPDSASLSDFYGTCSVSSLPMQTATDSCGTTISGTNDAVFPITADTTVVTWTYTDGGGNDTTQTQNVFVTCPLGMDDRMTSTVSIYPNPAQSFLTFSIEDAPQGQIIVFDIMGRQVMIEALTGKETVLDLSRLQAKGTYFAKIIDAEGSVLAVKKFIYQ